MPFTNMQRPALLLLIFCSSLSWSNTGYAAPGTLADTPLFTTTNTPPNIFFEIDDSGSMDWEYLTRKHWNHCLYDRDAPGATGSSQCFINWRIDNGLFANYDGSHSWWYFDYLYNNNDNGYGTSCGIALESCSNSIIDADWRILSSDFNVLYFNPALDYLPWQGTGLNNASFASVLSNPQPGTAGNASSTAHNLNGFVYEVWEDSHGYSGSIPARGTNINRTVGANGEVDLWDEHTRYTVSNSPNQIKIEHISYDPTSSGSNKGQLNETATLVATISGDINSPHAELGNKSIAEIQQNIANWYGFFRRRSFATKSAVSKVITANPNYRYGLSVINNYSSLFTEVPSSTTNLSSHNSTLLNNFFDYDWPNSGTPLRQGLERTGKYFDNTLSGKTNPITEQCQQNFSILLTDGYWNGSSPSVSDADGDGIDNTLADVAKYYYDNDLSPLDNVVPTNKFDTANHQHMVTFGVSFGITGLLTDTDADGWPGTTPGLSESDNWGNPFSSDPEKIDDLWHASFNGKGTYVSAANSKEVSDALNSALANIGSRIGSASSVSFNTTTLTGSSAVYLALFDNTNNIWTGDLLSFALDPITGNVATTPTWSAAQQLDNLVNPVSSRTIISRNDTGIAFRWDQLSTAQKNDLKINPDGSSGDESIGEARLNYLRGDQSNESGNNGNYSFRERSSLLLDIIHSDPVFVGKPHSNWPDTAPFPTSNPYSTFISSYALRPEMIYVGANDGMLHGFKADDGLEKLAYIPSYLFSTDTNAGLHFLSSPNYLHKYYVDMPSTAADVYIDTGSGTAWHTLLIGGSRGGGRGIFALDITNPVLFSENHANQLALWEFDSDDDPDMGYAFNKPTIGLMNNGRWAAIFGNGYNSTGDGKAKLFILFLDGGLDGVWTAGTDYIEISTGVGSIVNADCTHAGSNCNGLSTPQTADTNNDYVIDRVYAGDLAGNLWAFDVSDNNSNNWQLDYSANPLFIAGQPITSKPAIVEHPAQSGNGANLLVFFGTGQYLVTADITSTDTQAFYGVWDHGEHSITTSRLVEQTFLSGPFYNNGLNVTDKFSVLSNNYVDYQKATPDLGWYIQFTQNSGERLVTDPDIYGESVFFNTWIPENTSCSAGGYGILMSVNQVNGGRPSQAIFDLNGDNLVDINDLLTDSGNGEYGASGQRFDKGLPSSSSFLSDYQYTPGTDGGTEIDKRKISFNSTGSGMKRISWQELK